jgi:uncharacterized protein YecE (DUF72 family)
VNNRKWYIGCSGFYYKEWKDVFYPKGLPQKEWFEYYTKHFNTLEINSSFYRFPKLANLKNWHSRSPDNFIFSLKVPAAITHYKQFRETERMLNDFYGLAREGLTEKLGPVLFQLPPKLLYSKDALEVMLAQIDYSFLNAIEFRNSTWWRPDVIARLKDKNIIFCGVSFPGLEKDKAIINNATCYYRFHGVPRLFYSCYDDGFLKKVFRQMQKNETWTDAFIYFNNTASMAALKNGAFVQMLAQKDQ